VNQPLHPNLAKLAATYDEIFLRWSRGQIDAAEARVEILALQARDDDGVLWSIDPESGAWLRKTITGEIVRDTPPSYGLATPTPHDLSSNPNSFDPNNAVRLRKVDDELLYSPSSLTGSTRRIGNPTMPEKPRTITTWQYITIAGVAVVAYLVFFR